MQAVNEKLAASLTAFLEKQRLPERGIPVEAHLILDGTINRLTIFSHESDAMVEEALGGL